MGGVSREEEGEGTKVAFSMEGEERAEVVSLMKEGMREVVVVVFVGRGDEEEGGWMGVEAVSMAAGFCCSVGEERG